jgi:iron complex outermembrane receptor protein
MHKGILLSILSKAAPLVGVLAAVSPCFAADAADEIIVTAQKRSERLDQVPLALSVTTGEELTRADARTVADIGATIVNLTVDPSVNLSGSSAAANFYIRGIGQGDFLLTTDPGVGLYVDGVYVSRSIGSLLDIADIARVEVLRGPQGTLYGRNTIGGAINVVTRKPEATASATIDLSTGSDNRLNAIATINLPLSDDIRSRFTVARLSQDGYVERPLAGDRLGNVDRYAMRGQLAIALGPDVDLLIAGDYLKADEAGGASTLLATYSAAGPPPNQTFIHNVALRAPGGIYDNRWIRADKFSTSGTLPSRSELTLGGASATLTAGLGGTELRSITAWRGFKTHLTRDGDQSPLAVYANETTVIDREFSQEIQLSSKRNDVLGWLIGGYYGRETGSDDSKLYLAGFDIQSGASAIKNENWALFGQTSFRPTPALGLTGGLRYTKESKSYTPDQFIRASRLPAPPAGLVLVPSTKVSRQFSNLTYRLAADYRWTDTFMTYVAWSTGFKSGGFTQRNSSPRPDLPTFEPETSKVAEIGAKYQTMDGRLRLSGAAFHTQYEDLQVLIIEQTGFAPLVRNAARAAIKGFELEAEARIARGSRLRFGLAHLDAKYREIDARAAEIAANNHLVRAPRWSMNATASQDIVLSDVGVVAPSATWSYHSQIWLDALNSPELRQPGYHVIDAAIALRPDRWKAELALGVHNLTNSVHMVSGNVNRSLGAATASFARPRQWYLRARLTL